MSVLFLTLLIWRTAIAGIVPGKSFYQQKLIDNEAVYFTPDSFKITADGKTDVSDELQRAIYQVKIQKNFGIVFIPEGKYLITKTIYIPASIRLIGYGKTRPVVILGKNSPGYQVPDETDKGKAKYMIWFTSGMVEAGKPVPDAHPGTFYSALSNIDMKIEDGNPCAVAFRAHYAQHCFVAHCDIYINKGKAGMFDVGNEMEDVRFIGGDYGIYTTKPSPGWQFMMTDTYFEGQRIAAIKTQEAGLTIVRMVAKNVPTVIDINDNYCEKLFMENCQFENVSQQALIISNEDNAHNQISLINVDCKNVPVLASYRRSGKKTAGVGEIYKIKRFVYGLQMEELNVSSVYKTIFKHDALKNFPPLAAKDIPDFPAIETWVNIKTLGAKGDGLTDDTRIIQEAIEKYPNIYFPQGWYRVTETIKLKPNTFMIGLSPIATQLILHDNTEAFGGFGSPKPMVEAPQGGTNILTGIGLSTGTFNYRAVACKWMAGEKSYMNDVKFIGGHGSANPGKQSGIKIVENTGRENRRNQSGFDPGWDTQYWSLWITNGGGGTFKNIWTANTFATNGIYVSNTSTPGRIYAMSIEHHVKNEARFKNVSNWKVYAFQLEEESRESFNCQPVEIEHCSNMVFGNLWAFRVIRLKNPYPYSVRIWDCSNLEFYNIHNYTQIKYTTTVPLYDVNTNIEVRPWELNFLKISGNVAKTGDKTDKSVQWLAKGFEFADGICHDSKGNVYFSESRWKRIYKWSVETNSLSMVADFQWEPFSLACDSKDNLLVVFRYNPQNGLLVNGKPEVFTNPADAEGTSFSGWGNSGYGTLVYSINPNNPDETIQMLKKVPMGSIANIHKALYPSNRWRDSHDFNAITLAKPTECWVAPDGVTIIPICYDLTRANVLVEAFPGTPLYASDEYDKRVVKLAVSKEGYLSDLSYFVERGEFSTTVDKDGNLYVADGDIYVFDKTGKAIQEIKTPERPITITIGGKDSRTLFITTATSLYRYSL